MTLVCALIGVAATLLFAGCGSSNDKIPEDQATALSKSVEQARDYFNNGKCAEADAELADVNDQIGNLDVSGDVRDGLDQLIGRLDELSADCTPVEPTTSSTTTSSTTETTSSDTTSSDTTETSTSTKDTTSTDTTSTSTSTSTSTTDTNPPGNGQGGNGQGGNTGGTAPRKKAKAAGHGPKHGKAKAKGKKPKKEKKGK